MTSSRVHPNLYIFIVGHPGVGKTRSIREGRRYFNSADGLFQAPISMTFASLVDNLVKAKRFIPRLPDDPLEYNSMYICPDEMGTFIHKYDNEMIDGLSTFYDPDPYSQERRTSDIKIKIASPQLNILTGATPSNLLNFMPERAWGQGFTSRLIMVFSDERFIGDDFAPDSVSHSVDLEHDLQIISGLVGKFDVTEVYRNAVMDWRTLGCPPVPAHPKLIHYNTRRHVQLYKLSMVSAIDRSNALILTKDDFNRAMGWLLEAEDSMGEIFKAGATNADGAAISEILHFVTINDRGKGVSEQRIARFAQDLIPIHSIMRVIEIMEGSGQIHCIGQERLTGIKHYTAKRPGLSS